VIIYIIIREYLIYFGIMPYTGGHKANDKVFSSIYDPRQQWKTDHNLAETLVMAVCAIISNCELWEEIADFCATREGWFREKLGLILKNGTPSHDTFQRVFQIIKPEEFEKSFIEWTEYACRITDGEIVNFDGKTVKGSKGGGKKAMHMASAWASSCQMVLGQLKVNEKSNA